MIFSPQNTVLAGVPEATLQQWLTSAQFALNDLMTGNKAVSVAYDGKSVTYKQGDQVALTQWIHQLQRQLGLVPPRRAIRPVFR